MGDAAFATPELFERLEEEGFQYAIRLKSNDILHQKVEPFLKRGVCRPSRTPVIKYHSLLDQEKSWDKPGWSPASKRRKRNRRTFQQTD